ncbi:MAG: MBL fold metallo-hydrolase [Burkholderiales bacterium]|nr:MBL fold metallo-hydrolase [Burkholderiales bacterium]
MGQGLAVVVRTAGHALVYDAGPAYGTDADAGERVVVPHLRGAGIAYLDALVVTHDDADHAGGAASVRRAVEVGRVHAPLAAEHAALAGAPYRLPCSAGQRWTWDGVEFAFLHPTAASYADPWLRPNSRSCVLRIGTAYGAVLLAGDIEARRRRRWLRAAPPLARACCSCRITAAAALDTAVRRRCGPRACRVHRRLPQPVRTSCRGGPRPLRQCAALAYRPRRCRRVYAERGGAGGDRRARAGPALLARAGRAMRPPARPV